MGGRPPVRHERNTYMFIQVEEREPVEALRRRGKKACLSKAGGLVKWFAGGYFQGMNS